MGEWDHGASIAFRKRSRSRSGTGVLVRPRSQRRLLGKLIELWPSSAWLAAGASSAKQWLLAYTNLSYREAHRLERIAGLSARHCALADAVVSGGLTLSPSLFGGGQIHGSLAPVPFANVKTAVDAWTQDPDPAEQFSRSQRRALAARDRHCVFPSCTRPPRHCDAHHHLHHRSRGGPTTVDNGALLCRFHHRLIHQHGWNLFVDDAGHWVAVDPHGTHWTGRPTER